MNYIYIVLISYGIITFKNKLIDWMANKIRAKHLGIQFNNSQNDPKRIIKRRIANEIKLTYENITNPLKQKLNRR